MPTFKCKNCGTQFENSAWAITLKCPTCKTRGNYWMIAGAGRELGKLITIGLLLVLIGAFLSFWYSDYFLIGLPLLFVGGIFLIIAVPLVGILMLRQRAPSHIREQASTPVTSPPSSPLTSPPPQEDTISKLERLNALKEKGAITDEEFKEQKVRILSQQF